MHQLYFLTSKRNKVLKFDMVNEEVRILKLKRYADNVHESGILVDQNGTVIITGGFNLNT